MIFDKIKFIINITCKIVFVGDKYFEASLARELIHEIS